MHVARPQHLWVVGFLMILAISLPSKQAFWVPTTSAQTSTAITYSLATAGRVSLAVYNPEGKLVRTLLNATQRTAGTHTEQWDGKDDAGNILPTTATYTWKLLQTQGLRAQYQVSLGSTFPTGTGDVWWEQTLGNHDGVRSVAADSTGIYFATGISEIAPNGLKLSLDGTRRLWSSHQPNVFRGRFALSSMDGWLYGLQQDSYVGAHGIDKPNVMNQSVGDTSSPWYTGFRWDALWPGDTRSDAEDWCCSEQPMDMAAYNSGTNPQVVLSYLKHNTVQWRDPRVGTVLDSATITAPKGIALDNAGNMLVISEGHVLKLSRTNKTPQTVISGLTDPYRLDVDRTTGDMLVAERGTSQQVKRFSAAGQLLGRYGSLGGRSRLGAYITRAAFIDAVDIAALPDGGFIVADDPRVAPRRTSRYTKYGTLVKEWFASSPWTSYSSPDPNDPSTVWYIAADRRVARARVDYATRSWTVEATYSWDGYDALFGGDPFYNGFRVRTRNGVTYLAGEDNTSVLRVDSARNTLLPCATANWDQGVGGTQQAYTWADANGDGLAQETEYRRFPSFGRWSWQRGYFRSDANLNFVGYSETDKNIFRIDVTGWTAASCPIFRDLPQVDAAPYGESVAGVNALAKAFISPQTDGSVRAVLNVDLQDWGKPTGTHAVSWDSDGKVRWSLDNMVPNPNTVCCDHSDNVPPPPGKVYAFRQIVGVTNGSVVANDYDGGWDGHQNAITYVWDRDGLWVGGLFENVDTTVAPRELYTLSSDNRGGDLWTDPTTGDVYLFGSWDADYRIYKITGWDNWVRQSGTARQAEALPVKPDTYAIISRVSDKGLDVAGVGTDDGVDVQQWTYVGGSNQKWQLETVGGGEYKITALHSGKSLDVDLVSSADGARIQQWTYVGGGNQRWRIVSTGDGWFTLRAVHSGKCLDVPDEQTGDGVRVKQWQCHGGTNQQWKFQAVTP